MKNMSLLSEITKKSELAFEIFEVLGETTIEMNVNPQLDIEKIQNSLEKTKDEINSLNSIILEASNNEEIDDLSIKTMELAKSLVRMFNVLYSAQEMAIKYIDAKSLNKNEFLETRFHRELQKCIKEGYLVESDKFDEILYGLLEIVLK